MKKIIKNCIKFIKDNKECIEIIIALISLCTTIEEKKEVIYIQQDIVINYTTEN